jgi:putative ABC transport system substrate-binding protein
VPDAFTAISKFAIEHNVPIAGASISADGHGVVLGNLSDNVEVGELAASLANQIFKGIAAGTIPVISPESHVHINYKVAQEMGLTVPEGILSQAEEIIR